jgi:hypothetical protein
MVGKDGTQRSSSNYLFKQSTIMLSITEKQMMAIFKHGLDKFLDKIISRKLLVWLTATGLLAFSDLESHDWVMISIVYIGGQSAVDIITRLKGNGS